MSTTSTSPPINSPSVQKQPFTFHSIFCDLQSTTTPELDETEAVCVGDEMQVSQTAIFDNNDSSFLKLEPPSPTSMSSPDVDSRSQPKAMFYLDESSPQSHSPSTHWSTLHSYIQRFRHLHHHHSQSHPSTSRPLLSKQTSMSEFESSAHRRQVQQRSSASFVDRTHVHRFLKRSETNIGSKRRSDFCVNDELYEFKAIPLDEDFPELRPSGEQQHRTLKKNRKSHSSVASFFHHFHPHHHQSQDQGKLSSPSKSISAVSKSTSSLSDASTDTSQQRLTVAHKVPSKCRSSPLFPKFFSHHDSHRNSDPSHHEHKHRIGNLMERLHHKKKQATGDDTTNMKFNCSSSSSLIKHWKSQQEQNPAQIQPDFFRTKSNQHPVIMKRVHTWHSFDIRPIEQCKEY
ncbi:unnamed protein product [Didymodactylos carnosus]|uniref:Uncharacterized protein n=1 Tax=Didymodactylos carnosus TaxID=1234261 RepID=A0A815ZC07_9BILA|nr:unnamed protein product [Didymodactylos carnosus]CAF1580823.1 unnamed protein product [Didymodactylos carnosus]CAF4290347.1 unnamed protein product [Didymodactylos carnosus]CAF4448197.1 unnamed protein product [Didymodactylos carnosus]